MEKIDLQSTPLGLRTVEKNARVRLGQWRNALGQWRKLLGQWRNDDLLNPLKTKAHSCFEKAPHSLPEYNLNRSPLGEHTFQAVDNSLNGFQFALRANVFKTLRLRNCDWLCQPRIFLKALRAGEGRKKKRVWKPVAVPSFPTSPLTAGGGRFFWRKLQ